MRKTEVSTDSVSEFELGETEADEWGKDIDILTSPKD